MVIFNYTVNYIDIALVALLLIFIIVGYFRGLFINIANFIRWAVGMFLCFFLSENLSGYVYTNYVKPKAIEYIGEKIVTSTNLDEVLSNLQSFGEKLPPLISQNLDFSNLSVSGDDLAKSILENYFEGMLIIAVKAAIFIAVFILFFFITGLIIHIIQRRSRKREERRCKKSFVKKTDRFLGALFGALKGAIAVFAIVSVLMLLVDANDDAQQMSAFLKEVNTSGLLKLLDSINPFNAITGGLL